MPTYHVHIGNRRTTISLDKAVAEYLALHLGHEPDSRGAHGGIRVWLQAELDRNGDKDQTRVSQWLRGRAVAVLVSDRLRDAHGQWSDKIVAKDPLKSLLKRSNVA